jgi:hypothetical protein
MRIRKKIAKYLSIALVAYLVLSVLLFFIHWYTLTQCGMCLKSMASNIRVYRFENDGQPLSWDEITAQDDFMQNSKTCPRIHKEYIYRGNDVNAKMPKDLILIYGHKHPMELFEKISIFIQIVPWKNEIGVVFNDWSIEFLSEKEFEAAIKRDNMLRKELGLNTKQAE